MKRNGSSAQCAAFCFHLNIKEIFGKGISFNLPLAKFLLSLSKQLPENVFAAHQNLKI
jgi:hypothetical protein